MREGYRVTFTPTNVRDGVGRLQMRVRWSGGSLACNVGYEVAVSKWDRDAQVCVNNTTHGRKKVSASVINREIRRLRALFGEVEEELGYSATQEAVRSAFERRTGRGEARDNTRVLPAVDDFIMREGRLRMWTENTIRKYRTLQYSLRSWKGDSLRFRDLDRRGIEAYLLWLQEQGKRNDTSAKYLMSLRSFLRWAEDRGGYAVAGDWRRCEAKVKLLPKTIVWLTWKEVVRLCEADIDMLLRTHACTKPQGNELSPSVHRAVRDAFCLSCLTGMRYSDVFSLRSCDIRDGRIFLTIRKTGEAVTIELNRRAREIVERRRGRGDEPLLPYVSNPVCNRLIKRLCRWTGIDTPTTVTYLEGNERVQESLPKHELVTMHTGRRTFICNALEKGISPNVVMKWTGHRSYDEMRPYIDISDRAKESAMRLMDD